jgi:hypothetical protein
MTMRRSRAFKPKPKGIRAGSSHAGPATQDAEGRAVVRSLEDVAREKATLVAYLNGSGNTPEKLGEQMAKLKNSIDPRVRLRAVELEARIRGFYDDEPEKGGMSLNIVINVPEVARVKPLGAVVVAQPPTLPATNGYVGNGSAHP